MEMPASRKGSLHHLLFLPVAKLAENRIEVYHYQIVKEQIARFSAAFWGAVSAETRNSTVSSTGVNSPPQIFFGGAQSRILSLLWPAPFTRNPRAGPLLKPSRQAKSAARRGGQTPFCQRSHGTFGSLLPAIASSTVSVLLWPPRRKRQGPRPKFFGVAWPSPGCNRKW
jgi:hypothetical protein